MPCHFCWLKKEPKESSRLEIATPLGEIATPCLYSHTLSALLPHLKGVFKGNLKGNLNESLEESLKDLDKNQKSQLFPQKNIEYEF